jgi:hypothetical protein
MLGHGRMFPLHNLNAMSVNMTLLHPLHVSAPVTFALGAVGNWTHFNFQLGVYGCMHRYDKLGPSYFIAGPQVQSKMLGDKSLWMQTHLFVNAFIRLTLFFCIVRFPNVVKLNVMFSKTGPRTTCGKITHKKNWNLSLCTIFPLPVPPACCVAGQLYCIFVHVSRPTAEHIGMTHLQYWLPTHTYFIVYNLTCAKNYKIYTRDKQ